MLFPLALAGTFINHAAFKGSKVLMSLFSMELHADAFQVGVLISLYSFLPLFLAIPVGRLSDRLGPRIPILIGTLGLAGSLFLPYLKQSLTILYLSSGLLGFFYIFFLVSIQHLIGSLGTGAQRTQNYSTFSLCFALTNLVGPMVTGFSIDLVGHRLTYLLLATSIMIPAVLWGFCVPIPRRPEETRPRSSMKDLLANAPLRRALIATGIVETGLELYYFYMPIYGHSLGISASVIGSIIGTFATAMLLMRTVMPVVVRKSSEEAVLCGSLLLAAFASLLFPLISSVVLLGGASFLLGLGLGCGAPLSMIIIFNRSPQGRQGEAMGMRQTANKFIQVIVPLAVGALGNIVGIGIAFAINTFVMAAGALIMKNDVPRWGGAPPGRSPRP
jgi:MFS family permease